ncbi:50S ribosomal protein 6 chloroplastic [Phtheirospermum japonicum]|uniref:50S ribosomal protein 6 chloroplastic n=1 Tax=Phtheirospermum japonicum TaxID=374723 RepID=A0A830C4R4_9LAMI|nr:50S ribosomal protein 6 chloroplastic [Phtheirospermum japonicum]
MSKEKKRKKKVSINHIWFKTCGSSSLLRRNQGSTTAAETSGGRRLWAGDRVFVPATEEGHQASYEDATSQVSTLRHTAWPHRLPSASVSPCGVEFRLSGRRRRRSSAAACPI